MDLFLKNTDKYFSKTYNLNEGKAGPKSSMTLQQWCDKFNRYDVLNNFITNNPEEDPSNISYKSDKQEYKFTCPRCGKIDSFKLRNGGHTQRLSDTGEANLKCHICSRLGKSIAEWCKEHNRNDILSDFKKYNSDKNPNYVSYIDSKNKYNFKCSECDKIVPMLLCYDAKNGKIIHRLSDNGETYLVCKICSEQNVGKNLSKNYINNAPKLIDWCKKHKSRGELLLNEWDYSKNNLLEYNGGSCTPEKITQNSGKKVWWKCSFNPEHEWKAKVASRVSSNSNCPICWKAKQTSEAQEIITYYINKVMKLHNLPEVSSDRTRLGKNRELDIFIPKEIASKFGHKSDLAIEYNGEYFHKKEEIAKKDKWKIDRCNELDIQLIVIDALQDNYDLDNKEYVESNFIMEPKNNYYAYYFANRNELEKIIQNIIEYYFNGTDIKVNFNNDSDEINNLIKTRPFKQSFGYNNLNSLIDWDDKHNPFIIPKSGITKVDGKYIGELYNFKCHICGTFYKHNLVNLDKIQCPIDDVYKIYTHSTPEYFMAKVKPIKITCLTTNKIFNDANLAASLLSDTSASFNLAQLMSSACWKNNGTGIYKKISSIDNNEYEFQYDKQSYDDFIDKLNKHINWTSAQETASQEANIAKWQKYIDYIKGIDKNEI